MKNVFRAFAIITVIGLTILVSHELVMTDQDSIRTQSPPEKQTYVSEVVLRALWAEKNLVYDGEESPPGEFGLHSIVFPDSLRGKLPDPPLPQGPTAFTVAPNGDIYITDPLNKRIQRFSAGGGFISVIPIPHFEKSKYVNGYAWEWSLICVDRSDNVYLLWWEDYTEQYLCKYSQDGTLLSTYPFFPEVRIGGALNKLCCTFSDTLFFEYYRWPTNRIILSVKEYHSFKGRRVPFTFVIGTDGQAFSPEQQKSTLRRESLRDQDLGEINVQNRSILGEALALENMWNLDFVDQKGNVYCYWSTTEGIAITMWHQP